MSRIGIHHSYQLMTEQIMRRAEEFTRKAITTQNAAEESGHDFTGIVLQEKEPTQIVVVRCRAMLQARSFASPSLSKSFARITVMKTHA